VISTAGSGARHAPLTARAAVLVVAVASVILAVALPFKVWLGQRGQIASLTAQTHQAQAQLRHLNAQANRWQDPAYVESQARKRLHYALPGHDVRIKLGGQAQRGSASSARGAAAAGGPWYSVFWRSVQVAGAQPAK
jgi:Septum formation initiator